ncbi:methyltransferase [Rhizobium sp. BK251]|uniref:methyltransferase n=1 Tax=Rhizobium sp. BK251 TaxID=2512125 RepID=UPI00104CD416|nr:methyltransferase [Rhizobium sp. BK251]TCL74670.1 hydroxyneurosporene-O-methyltransferase [Rhizobium sp. BK251]
MSKVDAGMDALADMAFLIRALQMSRMIEVICSLGLPDHLGEGPRPLDELAAECGADPQALLRLCRALAAFKIFSLDEAGNISHTERSHLLRANASPTLHHAARYWGMRSTWSVWGHLEQAIRTGNAPFEAIYGIPFFEYLKAHPAESDVFNSFMQHSPDDRHAAVVEAYDFSTAGVVVDIGGGSGALLNAILSANPRAEGILFDQEAVVALADGVLGTVAERCKTHAGSFFDSVPSGGDVYTLSQILHDWSDEHCLTILKNCRAAMHNDARLLVVERILETAPDRANPLNFLSDIHMMMLFPGAKERTPAEFTKLFREAGLADPRIIATRSAFCIIETRVRG